jgi:hypothetical protein
MVTQLPQNIGTQLPLNIGTLLPLNIGTLLPQNISTQLPLITHTTGLFEGYCSPEHVTNCMVPKPSEKGWFENL